MITRIPAELVFDTSDKDSPFYLIVNWGDDAGSSIIELPGVHPDANRSDHVGYETARTETFHRISVRRNEKFFTEKVDT